MKNDQKLCEITDLIPVRIFPDRGKKMGPIKPMLMSNSLIFSILNSRPAPKHFFALNPNNPTRKILLTKDNYNKTTEELFDYDKKDDDVYDSPIENVNIQIEDNVIETSSDNTDVVKDTISKNVSVEDVMDINPEISIDMSGDIDVSIGTETVLNVDDIEITNIETNNNNQYKSKKNRKNR